MQIQSHCEGATGLGTNPYNQLVQPCLCSGEESKLKAHVWFCRGSNESNRINNVVCLRKTRGRDKWICMG